MALWQPGQKLYLPPTPVTKVLCTDTYVTRREIYYHAETERLLSVGHPYYPLKYSDGKEIPKVSPNQYRVFKVVLPDPNQFALPDKTLHDPSKERLVWALVGMQVSRGQPLGAAITGHPYLNVYFDAENMSRRPVGPQTKDDRKQGGLDSKQTQVLLVGCIPATGEYWDIAKACAGADLPAGSCPPLELKNKIIEDGDMMEIGFGAANFQALNQSKSDVPLDIENTTCIYPDYLKMSEEASGNSLFFFARKEQVYTRHIYSRGGVEEPEKPPDGYILKRNGGDTVVNNAYMGVPSGSLVSTESQIFNRPYWIYMAQGMNNGVAWNNTLYVTVGDNTRGINIGISVPKNGQTPTEFDSQNINMFQRHVEEYKLAFILQLCSVQLTSETVAHLQFSDPTVLENWQIGMQPPVSSILEDSYRYITSAATKCPDQVNPPKPNDPYEKNTFWLVDLKEKLSLDLDQFPLGRRFLAQRGLGCRSRPSKRVINSKQQGVPAKKRKRTR